MSTPGQADEGISLEAQRSKISAWCEVNDVELLQIFEDAGISGKRADNRPALQEALNAVAEENGVLIVYSLSRLARSTKDTLQIAERLDKAGADLVSLSEKIDTTSASGKMVFRLLAVLNEFERDLISERTTAAMAHLREQNRFLGQVPYGFRLSDDGGSIETDPAEQKALGRIRSLHAEGLSLRAIAKKLDAEGFAAKSGRKWAHTSVASVLRRAS
ncbi:MAG: recombinase family protein [Fuerstiella sp.]|nr:recombinase family protein [Fuerstiella sp.]